MLYPYTLAIFTLYAYDAKGLSGWGDLKGRKILNGPPRGAATTNSRGLAQLYGGVKHEQDYESVTVNWNQASAAIVDGTADAAVLKVLGATRPGILKEFLFEYGLRGCVAGVVSAFVGVLASWAVVQFLMRIEWQLDVFMMVVPIILGVFITLFLGFINTWWTLGQKTTPFLRNN